MGFNLSAGLAAADAYFKEDDRRKEREYRQALRDADLSVLPEHTAARRAGHQAQTARSQADMQTLPGQTANTIKRQQYEGTSLDRAAGRQGAVEDAADLNAQTGLTNANIANSASKAQLDMLPQKLRQAKIQGVIDEQGQSEVVVGTMGRLLAANDKEGFLKFANAIAAQGDVLPGTNGQTIVDVIPEKRPDGDYYTLVEKSGKKFPIPVAKIKDAMGKMQSGKYKFIERGDGSVFAGNEQTGTGRIVQPGDPTLARGRTGQHTPAEIQTMEWLISKGVAKTPQEAWDRVRSAREKTRTDFIADYLAKSAMPGQDMAAAAKQAGELYDQLKAASGMDPGLSGAPSNTGNAGKIDPYALQLIGAQ